MSATREPTFSPGKAMANVASYLYPIASVESDNPVSVDPDLSSNVDPDESAIALVDESEKVVLPESDDETLALSMEKREGPVVNSEGSATADDESAAAKTCPKDESFRIQDEEFPPLVDVKKSLAVIDLSAKPLSDDSRGSTPAAKTSVDKDAVSTSKEDLLPEGAPTEPGELHPKMKSSPKNPKRETSTGTQDENNEETTRTSCIILKCHTSEPNKSVSESKLENRETKVVEQKTDGEQAANGHHTTSRSTSESKKANPSKMKTKRSNQADVSRDKAAGDYRAPASRQSPRRKKPEDDELPIFDLRQFPRVGKSPQNKAEERDNQTPTGGHQRGRGGHPKGGILEDPADKRRQELRVACRDMKPPGHSTDGSLPFRYETKTRKARNLKLWKALKKWTFLGKLAATSDVDRYLSNNLDLFYCVAEFTSNLGLAALGLVVGQSAVDRLDSLATKGMTPLLDIAANLKALVVRGETFLFISGLCSSWIGRPLLVVTSLATKTARKALAAVDGAYDGLGLRKKRAEGVCEQGLLKLFLRGLCFPAWATVYLWATMLFLLNSTLLHSFGAKRTWPRRKNRSHSKILQGHSPSGRKSCYFQGCTSRAACELDNYEKIDPRNIFEQQGHQDRKTKEGGVSQVRRHQAMTSTPQGINTFQDTGRKRRPRAEQGDDKSLHMNGQYDEIDCMTIVVHSDIRQVKVTPRQDEGLRAEPSAGARLRKVLREEVDVQEAENDEEEIEQEADKFYKEDQKDDQKDEDEDGVEFEPERSRAAGKENGTHQLRVSFLSELSGPPTPDDGEGGIRHSDHESDVDRKQMAKGRRITPIKRRLRGVRTGGLSPATFRLLGPRGSPSSWYDGAKFDDLSVGNQFLCILRKLPFLSDIVRDPRDPAPLAYLCDVPTFITDDDTRRLLELAHTSSKRGRRELKRKLDEVYSSDDEYDSEEDPDYQPDEPDTTDPLEYTEAEAAGVSEEDEDDVIHHGDVTHTINAEVHREDKKRDMKADSLGKDETDITESQDYEREKEDSATHWKDLDTEVTLD